MDHLAFLLLLCGALAVPGRGLAARGQCTYFKRGGTLWLKNYVCCNNCDENDGEPACGETTYIAADTADDKIRRSNAYCGPCGEDLGGARETGSAFGCGGCEGQARVKEGCDRRYVYAAASFCWLHSKCFELRCQREAQAAVQGTGSADEPYCGDTRCDPTEDAAGCPFDCCPLRNPEECRHPHHCSKCPPVCCAEPGCCLD
ncbi:Hypp5793 [Branchiostoma lanceolatum]|uniref:Hypp5793 protein n=1 Tax=Branchiostoma lanceolatum TaxID=7740 RepID=A0A8J9VG70_BRALA|nr:Hypp5793 [Branchiostoma lanceolatum]